MPDNIKQLIDLLEIGELQEKELEELEKYLPGNISLIQLIKAIKQLLENWNLPLPNIELFQAQKAALYLLSQIFYDDFHYPQPQVGRYDIVNNNFEKLKWVYRHWLNQLEVAEKDSGIENYFREQTLEFPLPEDFEETHRASLSSGGDILAVDVLTTENTTELFDDVKDFYFSADLVCANLESSIYWRKPFGRSSSPSGASRMNTSEGVFKNCYQEGNGINFYSTANNHTYDFGTAGVLATLEVLNRYGAYHAGTNLLPKNQEKALIIEQNGIKIAMLSFTMDLNGHNPPKSRKFLVNEVRFNDETCDIALVEKQVADAREQGADIIVACCHWGWEFEMYPHKNVMEVGHRIIELGVDVILGNHPHVAQPMERYTYEKDGETKHGLIAYASGDFVAYHPLSRNSHISYIIKFDIVKGIQDCLPATYITNLKMLPVYMLNEQIEGEKYNCRMLKFSHVLADKGEDGNYKYGLTDEERKQLPHLNDVVLHKILLPEKHDGLLVEE